MLGTRFMRYLIIIGVMVTMFAIVVGACGGDDDTPAPSGASAEEIRQIVSEEVARSQQPAAPQVSMEEIGAMVESAMVGIAASVEGMSPEEIQAMVEGAVASAAAQGASPAEIRAMVEGAVVAASANAVTGEDVQSAITKAVMDAQAGMITSADMDKAVSSAVMQAAEGTLTAGDVRSLLDEGAQEALTEEQVAAIVAQALEERDAMMAMAARETIIYSDLDWTSAQVQNRIAQYITELGYGYPTDLKVGSTLPLFNGLRAGDTHVTMEIWLPNQDEAWAEAQSLGQVVAIGESLGKDWQSAFVIPAYLQEQYPDLDNVEDLKEDQYKMLFARTGTGGKARLVSCVLGWACDGVNTAQVTGYGLDDHVDILRPGDGSALNADLYGAYERQEPWLGYQWGTNAPALVLDLVRLEEPAYTDQCWFTTKACAYEDATILIAVVPDMLQRAPDVVSMLRNWTFDIDRYKAVAAWQNENPEATENDSALWWLKGNEDVWSTWVTDEAATSISAALAADTIPNGWPEQ